MNFKHPYSKPFRKPRDKGIAMMMDKGLGVNETEQFIETSDH